MQNAYSLADRSDQALLDACTADEVPYVPFFPLGSAFQPGKPVLTAVGRCHHCHAAAAKLELGPEAMDAIG